MNTMHYFSFQLMTCNNINMLFSGVVIGEFSCEVCATAASSFQRYRILTETGKIDTFCWVFVNE